MTTEATKMTGFPSQDLPWMKYYPPQLIENLSIPDNTVNEYLHEHCPGEDVVAIHYYGVDITWKHVFKMADKTARALRGMGFGEGDQIPVFLRATPEFVYLLLGAEKIGASLLCRDNTLEENVEAVRKSKAKVIFAHDYMSQEELKTFRRDSETRCVVTVSPYNSACYSEIPEHIRTAIDEYYPEEPAYGPKALDWNLFLKLGERFPGVVEAPRDIDRPLFRAYTSGSTGPSKQVIHSAHTMIGNLHQMNFYGASDEFRPTWLMTVLPPTLVAVVVAMMLLPMASNKLLILDPFCRPEDVDLEMMR